MRFNGRTLILLAFLLLNACSQAHFESQFSFDKSLAEIRYEGFDSQGQFIENKIVQDPQRENYFQGEWSASTTQIKTQAVQSSTSSLNRVHIVFVGDGYTAADLPAYGGDVSSNIQRFISQQPFNAYQNYFAFHKVDVVSPATGPSALEMQYGCNNIDRLLCINTSKASAAAATAPKVDVIFAMANSDRYGGAGYMSPAIATMAARNPSSTELALHEFGHSFGKLTDEYDTSGISTNCNSYANSSITDRITMLAKKTKWYQWLDLSSVGSFQGSCYSMQNFRPTMNSKMRSLGMGYDAVNTEQLIFRIYEKVRPIEFATPQGTLKKNQILQIGVVQQIETSLEIVWALDGKALSTLQGKTEINTADLGVKKGSVTVTVTDRTTRVRNEEQRKKLMSQTLTWNLKL